MTDISSTKRFGILVLLIVLGCCRAGSSQTVEDSLPPYGSASDQEAVLIGLFVDLRSSLLAVEHAATRGDSSLAALVSQISRQAAAVEHAATRGDSSLAALVSQISRQAADVSRLQRLTDSIHKQCATLVDQGSTIDPNRPLVESTPDLLDIERNRFAILGLLFQLTSILAAIVAIAGKQRQLLITSRLFWVLLVYIASFVTYVLAFFAAPFFLRYIDYLALMNILTYFITPVLVWLIIEFLMFRLIVLPGTPPHAGTSSPHKNADDTVRSSSDTTQMTLSANLSPDFSITVRDKTNYRTNNQ